MPLVIGGTAVAVFLAVFLGALGAVIPADGGGSPCQTAPGRTANTAIPPTYLDLYVKAGRRYGIPWSVLAAIGDAESDHGRGPGPGITSGTNHAGAAGPMQFLSATWKAFGVDGNGDGQRNLYDPADAIPGAAAYLKHNGAPRHLDRAIFAYNHADWYVKKILAKAAEFARGGDTSACAGVAVVGSGRGAVAVRAALRWLGTPYSWGGGGDNGPTEGFAQGAGIIGFDCSGLTRYAWHQARITLPRVAAEQMRATQPVPAGQEQPGDLVFFIGSLGSKSNPGHVGLVAGTGQMVEAPRTGLRVRVSSIRNRSDLIGYGRPTAR